MRAKGVRKGGQGRSNGQLELVRNVSLQKRKKYWEGKRRTFFTIYYSSVAVNASVYRTVVNGYGLRELQTAVHRAGHTGHDHVPVVVVNLW